MKQLNIIFSISGLILFSIFPLLSENKTDIDIVNTIKIGNLYFSIIFFILSISYLLMFLFIRKNNNQIYFILNFFTFLVFLNSLVFSIFSLKLSFFKLNIDEKFIYLILNFQIFFNLILFFFTAVLLKIKNYLLIIIFRFIFFIGTLFIALFYLGNSQYKLLYQYIIFFSIFIWKTLTSFALEEKRVSD